MKTGIVFEGGAFRTIFSCGVMDAFLEKNIMPDYIIGVSAGAAYGVSYASRQPGRNLKIILDYCDDKRYMGINNLLNPKNKCYYGLDFAYDTIPNKLVPFDYDEFDKYHGEFYAVVTNLQTGKAEYKLLDTLDNYDQVEYLRASGSMPFVSHIIQVNGHEYLDGGCSDSIPIKKMLEMDVDKIIVVLTRPLDYRKKPSNKHLNKLFYHQYPHSTNV